MSIRTGNDGYTYEIVEGWGMSGASGIDGTFDVAGVGIDSKENVYLFNRGPRPMIVLDRDGKILRSWGDKRMFPNAHAVTIGPDDAVWLTDNLDHTVRKCTPEGKVLLTLGTSAKPATGMSGEPFCRCTHVAIHPGTGELFVSDGYGNARVHKYAPDGRLLCSWGGPGNRPGQFNLPHNICTDRDGYVYVADRHNSRVQVFTPNGRLEAVWTGMALPCGMFIDTASAEQLCYVAELSSAWWGAPGPHGFWHAWNGAKTMGPRVSIYSLDGRLLAKLCDNGQGVAPDQFMAPHGIAVDRNGDIYVAEVSWTIAKMFNRGEPSPQPIKNAVKLAKIKRH